MESTKKYFWMVCLILVLSACQLTEPDARPLVPETAVATPTTSAEAAATVFTAQQQLLTPETVTIPATTSAALSTSIPDQPPWPDLSVLPPEFTYQPTAPWERYAAGGQTFIAWRSQAAEFASETAVATLIEDASFGVDDFISSDPVPTVIGERDWLWIDFTYSNVSGEPIKGFIAIQNDGQTETVVWAEAPQADYAQWLEELFFVVLSAD